MSKKKDFQNIDKYRPHVCEACVKVSSLDIMKTICFFKQNYENFKVLYLPQRSMNYL